VNGRAMSDDWLAAYEAQKAKALKKIEEGGTSDDGKGSLAGSTSHQGLVDVKEVRHLSRSTQITKLIDNYKKKTDNEVAAVKKPNPAAPAAAAAPPPKPVSSAPPPPKSDMTKNAGGPGLSSISNAYGQNAPSSGNLGNYNSTPGGGGSTGIESNKKAKKRQHDEPSVAALMKQVKKDASKSQDDWHSVYEQRKREALEAIKNSKDTDRNVAAMSAYHAAGKPNTVGPKGIAKNQGGAGVKYALSAAQGGSAPSSLLGEAPKSLLGEVPKLNTGGPKSLLGAPVPLPSKPMSLMGNWVKGPIPNQTKSLLGPSPAGCPVYPHEQGNSKDDMPSPSKPKSLMGNWAGGVANPNNQPKSLLGPGPGGPVYPHKQGYSEDDSGYPQDQGYGGDYGGGNYNQYPNSQTTGNGNKSSKQPYFYDNPSASKPKSLMGNWTGGGAANPNQPRSLMGPGPGGPVNSHNRGYIGDGGGYPRDQGYDDDVSSGNYNQYPDSYGGGYRSGGQSGSSYPHNKFQPHKNQNSFGNHQGYNNRNFGNPKTGNGGGGPPPPPHMMNPNYGYGGNRRFT